MHDELDEFKTRLIAFLIADKLNIKIENIDRESYEMTLTFSHKDIKENEHA